MADTMPVGLLMCIYFNGRCGQKLGASGVIAFAPGGQLLCAEARYHGQDMPTNNQAKAQGLLLALKVA